MNITMKGKRITFSTSDAALQPGADLTVAQGMQNVLVNAISMAPTTDTPQERKKWKILDLLEDNKKDFVTVSSEEFEILKRFWEVTMPQAQVGYKWKRAVDEAIENAQEVELKEG